MEKIIEELALLTVEQVTRQRKFRGDNIGDEYPLGAGCGAAAPHRCDDETATVVNGRWICHCVR